MELRPARETDDDALARLDAVSWPLELQVAPPSGADEPFFGARRAPSDVIVATEDDAIVGYVQLARHMPLPKNDHVLHLNALVVGEGQRGRGTGHLLVDAAVAEARARGARKLGLRALSTNAVALRLYAAHGFTVEGTLKDEIRLPDGSYADDVWLARFLADD